VARYVERVMWHPTQRFKRTAKGLEMTMDVRGTTEVVSWVLGFGANAQVLAPEALRKEIAEQLTSAARAAARSPR
jgi:predicted DNA-binding transcriptional regulator YafY